MKNNYQMRYLKNNLYNVTLFICSLIVIIPLFLILGYIVYKGISSLNIDFFIQTPKPVGETGGGMGHAILGTLYMCLVACILSVPPAIMSGIFLSEYKDSKLAVPLKLLISLMAGIPSIVIGIFAYILLVISFKSFSALAGSFALAIIIFPIVSKNTEEVLKLVSPQIKEAGLALGLPKWKVTYRLIVKSNLPAITTGVIIGLSRATGETAPLLFTAFGSRFYNFDPTKPMASLPLQIYNYATSPFEDWQNQAWAGSLVLIILIILINLFTRLIINKAQIKPLRTIWKIKKS